MGAAPEASLAAWWWLAFGYGVGERLLAGVLDRHREPHRRYHTATHVEWVLRHIDTLAEETPLVDPGTVLAAAFFHDAVYDPTAGAGANERASAALAARELTALGWAGTRAQRVAALVVATAGHEANPGDDDMKVLLDADMAVLGSDAAAYDAYAHGVRAEYRHLDDAAWVSGRSAVLQHFLDRERIFATNGGWQWWEARARANIAAELAALGRPSRE